MTAAQTADRRAGAASAGRATPKLLLGLFMLAFLIPAHLNLGSLTMGVPRLYLFVMFLPVLFMTLGRKLCLTDALIVLYIVWISLSIFVNHGMSRMQFVGLQIVDMGGAYLLARALVRTEADYRFFWRLFGWGMLVIFPFALAELLTEQLVLHALIRPVLTPFPDITWYYPRRLGFERVMGNFEHPILFGVFWGLGLAPLLSVFRTSMTRILFGGVCLMMVGMSLSSGAWLAAIFQIALLAWGLATRNNWKLLLILFAILYVAVEVLSDRPAAIALSTRLAFSAETAYWRLHIWNYGVENVQANPIFGLGLRDWVRPAWLSPSVDNNWLLVAMRGGLPAILFLLGGFGSMLFYLLRRRDMGPEAALLRRNFTISFVAMFIALCTVAVWSGTSSFLLFMLGMGVNMTFWDSDTAPDAAPDPAPDSRTRRRVTQSPRAGRTLAETPPPRRDLPLRSASAKVGSRR